MEPNQKMQVFKAQTQEKIRKLIAEFAEGMVSREQFHVIYERYTSQLAMADMAAASRSPDAVMNTGVRFTVRLHRQLLAEAKANRRSFNSEISLRLEQSLKPRCKELEAAD